MESVAAARRYIDQNQKAYQHLLEEVLAAWVKAPGQTLRLGYATLTVQGGDWVVSFGGGPDDVVIFETQVQALACILFEAF